MGLGLAGGVASQFLGRAFAPQIDTNQFVNPYEGSPIGKGLMDQNKLLAGYNQAPFREAQIGQIDYLQGLAQGTQPSIVEQQGQMAQQQALAQQQAQAQSAQGINAGMAQRLAMNNAAQAQAGIASQTQLARLQEIQQANQLLSGALQSGRQQDLGSQQLAGQGYDQIAQGALNAQRLKLQALESNMGAQNKTSAAFGSAIGGGLAGAGQVFGGSGGDGGGGSGGGFNSSSPILGMNYNQSPAANFGSTLTPAMFGL
jgi:hypothetical protein